MTCPWYPMAALVRHNVPVELRWAGWQGAAVWVREGTATPRWMAVNGTGRAARLDPLPPRRMRLYTTAAGEDLAPPQALLDRTGWSDGPTAWRPLRSDTWPDPLASLGDPLPDLVPEHVAVSIDRLRHTETDVAAMAAEMEADRAAANGRPRPEREMREPMAWWRDASRLTYSAPGRISVRECEGRVMRALYFLGRPDAPARERTNAAVLADLKRAADLAAGYAVDDYVPPLQRAPAETDDRLLEAMRWATEARAVIVLAPRASDHPLPWSRLGAALGITRQAAKKRYGAALAAVTHIANTGTPRLDAIRAEVITRNRAHASSA